LSQRLAGEKLAAPLVEEFLAMGIAGGQFPDGSQKDGFLKYEKGRPAAVFDPRKKAYEPLPGIAGRADAAMGAHPVRIKPWKTVIQDPEREKFLEEYFKELAGMKTLGADLAVRYGRKSKAIGLSLVESGVAAGPEDVNTVLLTGFYHAYGPINGYFD
jgi:hypothetical protein